MIDFVKFFETKCGTNCGCDPDNPSDDCPFCGQ